jgi:hypothetical protein
MVADTKYRLRMVLLVLVVAFAIVYFFWDISHPAAGPDDGAVSQTTLKILQGAKGTTDFNV